MEQRIQKDVRQANHTQLTCNLLEPICSGKLKMASR